MLVFTCSSLWSTPRCYRSLYLPAPACGLRLGAIEVCTGGPIADVPAAVCALGLCLGATLVELSDALAGADLGTK